MSEGALKLKRRGLKAAQDVVLDFSRQQLPDYFEGLLDELIALTEQSTIVGSKHEYFYAGSKIKDSRDSITDSFVEHFKTIFKKFAARTLEDADSLLDNDNNTTLALIEEEALEERVVLTTIKQRTEGRFRDSLWALNQRMSLLNDGIPVNEQLNPLAPARFCLACRDSLQIIDISTATKLDIYRIFDRRIMDQLGKVYSEANTALAELHVLPNLRHSVVKAAERGAAGGVPAPGLVAAHAAGDDWLGGGQHAAPYYGASPRGAIAK